MKLSWFLIIILLVLATLTATSYTPYVRILTRSSSDNAISLTYEVSVQAKIYLDLNLFVSNNKSIEYKYSLIAVPDTVETVRVGGYDILVNKTPGCIILINNTTLLKVAVEKNHMVNLSLITSKAFLVCNVKPWFNFKGNLTLRDVEYRQPLANSSLHMRVYIGSVSQVLLSSNLTLNDNVWALFHGNKYIGDMIFAISKHDMNKNSTLLLFYHGRDIELKLQEKSYPTAFLSYVNYTNHPPYGFNYNNVSLESSDICLSDFWKPSLANIKMINPSLDILNTWKKIAKEQGLTLISLPNNTYIVKNSLIEKAYQSLKDYRKWKLYYKVIVHSKYDNTEFYRLRPFITIDNISYAVVPLPYNMTVLYDNTHGILLYMAFNNTLPPSTIIKRYALLPVDPLYYGLNIRMILYPRDSTLYIKLIEAKINKTNVIEIGGTPSINPLYSRLVEALTVASVIVVAIAIVFFIKIKLRKQ